MALNDDEWLKKRGVTSTNQNKEDDEWLAARGFDEFKDKRSFREKYQGILREPVENALNTAGEFLKTGFKNVYKEDPLKLYKDASADSPDWTRAKNTLKSIGAGSIEGLTEVAKLQLKPLTKLAEGFKTLGPNPAADLVTGGDESLTAAQEYLKRIQEEAAKESPEIESPLLTLPKIDEQGLENPWAKGGASAVNRLSDLASGLTSPKNIGFLGVGALGKLPAATQALSFLPTMVKGTFEGGKEAVEGIQEGDPSKIGAGAASALGSGLFTKGLLKSLKSKPAIPTPEVPPIDAGPKTTQQVWFPEPIEMGKNIEKKPLLLEAPKPTPITNAGEQTLLQNFELTKALPNPIPVRGPETFKTESFGRENPRVYEPTPLDYPEAQTMPDAPLREVSGKTKMVIKPAPVDPKLFSDPKPIKPSGTSLIQDVIKAGGLGKNFYDSTNFKNLDNSPRKGVKARFKILTDNGLQPDRMAERMRELGYEDIIGPNELLAALDRDARSHAQNGYGNVVSKFDSNYWDSFLERQQLKNELSKIDPETLNKPKVTEFTRKPLAPDVVDPLRIVSADARPTESIPLKFDRKVVGEIPPISSRPGVLNPTGFTTVVEPTALTLKEQVSNNLSKKASKKYKSIFKEPVSNEMPLSLENTSKPLMQQKQALPPPHKVGAPLASPLTEATKTGAEIPKIPVTEKPVIQPKIEQPLKPNEKINRVAQSIEIDAIANDLTKTFGDLPTHKGRNMKQKASEALDFINRDEKQAVKVAMGEANAPPGLNPEEVFTALRVRASKIGDVDTLRDLALNSKISRSEATILGQRIKALDAGLENDPVAAIKQIYDIRQEKFKRRTLQDPVKAKTREATRLAKEFDTQMKKSAPKANAWVDFVNSIRC